MKALVLVHQPDLRSALGDTMRQLGFDCTFCDDAAAALDAFRSQRHPLVIASWRAGSDGAQLFSKHARN